MEWWNCTLYRVSSNRESTRTEGDIFSAESMEISASERTQFRHLLERSKASWHRGFEFTLAPPMSLRHQRFSGSNSNRAERADKSARARFELGRFPCAGRGPAESLAEPSRHFISVLQAGPASAKSMLLKLSSMEGRCLR